MSTKRVNVNEGNWHQAESILIRTVAHGVHRAAVR